MRFSRQGGSYENNYQYGRMGNIKIQGTAIWLISTTLESSQQSDGCQFYLPPIVDHPFFSSSLQIQFPSLSNQEEEKEVKSYFYALITALHLFIKALTEYFIIVQTLTAHSHSNLLFIAQHHGEIYVQSHRLEEVN